MERKDMAQQTIKNMLKAGIINPALAPHEYGILIRMCDQDLVSLMIESHLILEDYNNLPSHYIG